jgi:hypothetical protein
MTLDKNIPGNNLTESTEKVIASDRDSSVLVSWLFLIGSLIFLGDGILELTEGISIHALLHLSASLLFTVGSVLFIPQSEND